MESRIQFRVSDEIKRLAQLRAQSQGRTLSDACRALTEQMALEQQQTMQHESWLKEQVGIAFAKLNSGQAQWLAEQDAEAEMSQFKQQFSATS